MLGLPTKIELPQKGQSAFLNSVKQLKATLKWNTATDFDLVAIYVNEQNQAGMIFFNDQGNLNQFPFMKLSGDAGIADTVDSGGNEETLVIAKIDSTIKSIYLVCWDYEAARNGKEARFDKNLKMQITSVSENSSDNLEVTLASGLQVGSNGVIVASIEKSGLIYEYKNLSEGFQLFNLNPSNILSSIGVYNTTSLKNY